MSEKNLASTYPKRGNVGGPVIDTKLDTAGGSFNPPRVVNRQDALSVPNPPHGAGLLDERRADTSSGGGHSGVKLDKTLSHVRTDARGPRRTPGGFGQVFED